MGTIHNDRREVHPLQQYAAIARRHSRRPAVLHRPHREGDDGSDIKVPYTGCPGTQRVGLAEGTPEEGLLRIREKHPRLRRLCLAALAFSHKHGGAGEGAEQSAQIYHRPTPIHASGGSKVGSRDHQLRH